MINTAVRTNIFTDLRVSFGQIATGFILVLIFASAFYAQSSIATQTDEHIVIIGDAKDNEVFSFGKTVIVKEHAKGVLAFGGDIIVEGIVDGDVATIGGSIIQKETAFIGGDVIAFGGAYRPECKNPLRNSGKETIMYAGYEEELRNLSQNPSQIFAPSVTWEFLTQRLILLLLWFIISLVLTTIAPGAVSRAVVRFQLSTLKVVAFGMTAFVLTTIGVMLSLGFLPNYIYAIVIFTAFILFVVSFVFGRVALQVSVGKQIQKRLFRDNRQSETLALFIGTFFWTFLLSIPYLWSFALVFLVAASLGLVLTARSNNGWEKA